MGQQQHVFHQLCNSKLHRFVYSRWRRSVTNQAQMCSIKRKSLCCLHRRNTKGLGAGMRDREGAAGFMCRAVTTAMIRMPTIKNNKALNRGLCYFKQHKFFLLWHTLCKYQSNQKVFSFIFFKMFKCLKPF